jgi:preprotein translocase subunit SecA
MHHLNAALRSHALYRRDVEYIVANGEVIIVDEFTGRTMPGRRWSDGLHQAIEAKEGVRVREENQTVASITFQNYFRMYKKLAGMTGTADTGSVRVPADLRARVCRDPDAHADGPRGSRRSRLPDAEGQVRGDHRRHPRLRERKQPVLVGTTSVETSEFLSGLLKQKGHRPRGAEREAARARGTRRRARRAGPGSVTIATNMAGRGTDIVLGGSLKSELEQLSARGVRRRDEAEPRRTGSSGTRRSCRPAVCTSSAPSGTSRGVSTTSCAAGRAARATRARAGSTCRSKTT